MQRVDPFIPVRASHTPPVRAPNRTPQLVRQPAGTVEGFVRPRPKPLPHPAMPASSAAAEPPDAASPPPAKVRHSRLRGKLRMAGLVAAVLLAGTVAQTLAVGELLIAVYAVYAVVRRTSSQTTFVLVLISLGTVVTLRAVGKDAQLAANFAVYSLLLAFVGVVSLAREVRQTKR